MTPKDREVMDELVRGQTVLMCKLRDLAGAVMTQAANNAVLMAATGSLYAELARVSGMPDELDRLLERLLAVIETQSNQNAQILGATDKIREYAEAVAHP
ncbi:hypothetical protein [Sphingopyxis sp. KK2]|uniref:hypothetical protein n=1 Tax=Sphingopyxis sp. KK2 TaxID=1855727 RepID=UPI00097E56DA|nr:hypothetical protein [Sphingopyxis sp. KK2]